MYWEVIPVVPTIVVLTLTTVLVWALWPAPIRWEPKGRHCYVTGGSSGLGRALAILLTQRGANVSIVARNEERMKETLEEMEKYRQTEDQVLKSYSYALDDFTASSAALDAASAPFGGRTPDALFLCAGKATPRYFVEEDETTLKKGMDNAYWVQAWTALAASKRMVMQKRGGRIVFVSSVMGLLSFAGYSSYAPGKHALRGLAETLRNENLLYSVWTHIYYPGTIYSPGYKEESKTKPKLTQNIEAQDVGQQPSEAAEGLLNGVQRGHFQITNDFTVSVIRAATRGAAPMNNFLGDLVLAMLGYISLPGFRRRADELAYQARTEHQKYLSGKDLLMTRN